MRHVRRYPRISPHLFFARDGEDLRRTFLKLFVTFNKISSKSRAKEKKKVTSGGRLYWGVGGMWEAGGRRGTVCACVGARAGRPVGRWACVCCVGLCALWAPEPPVATTRRQRRWVASGPTPIPFPEL